jgi:hypothetical protein
LSNVCFQLWVLINRTFPVWLTVHESLVIRGLRKGITSTLAFLTVTVSSNRHTKTLTHEQGELARSGEQREGQCKKAQVQYEEHSEEEGTQRRVDPK